jgi:hypothetical protein
VIPLLVYVLAAVTIYRLWDQEHGVVFWILIAGVILMAWTASAVRNAAAMDARGGLAGRIIMDWEAAQFWAVVNMVLTGLTAGVSLYSFLTLP